MNCCAKKINHKSNVINSDNKRTIMFLLYFGNNLFSPSNILILVFRMFFQDQYHKEVNMHMGADAKRYLNVKVLLGPKIIRSCMDPV